MPDSCSSSSAVLYEIRPTVYGGRGVFSRRFIPKGAPILSCAGPYASVVLQKFKKEVCAWCFSYAFESGKGKWIVKPVYPDEPVQGKIRLFEAGLWFCSVSCRDKWVEKYEVGKGEGGLWLLEVLVVLEKHISEMKRVEGLVRASSTILESDDPKPETITPEFVDNVWRLAEELIVDEKKQSKPSRKTALSEFEVDTARFVLDGLASKVIEDVCLSVQSTPPNTSNTSNASTCGPGRWPEFLDLQNNELAYIRQNPYILASHVRIYRFLRELVSTHVSSIALNKFQPIRLHTDNNHLVSLRSNATKMLMDHLSTSSLVRALFGRDPGNTFGIWETTPDDQDSEMFGWGAYIFGSYFNHGNDL